MEKKFYFLSLRYFLLVLVALPNLYLFYLIFTPLTIYPVYYLLSLIYNTYLIDKTIIFAGISIQLINACIAGSGYYLLLILNLTTPMKIGKRVYSILFLFFSFLIVNIIRIFIFSTILVKSFTLFNTLHLLTWYFLSAVIVFLLWLVNINIFKIQKIPIYSDIKSLIKSINLQSKKSIS